MTGFLYLATPYSKFHDGLEAAYVMACKARAELIAAAVPCFSPIVHSHGVAIHGGLDPLRHDIWLPSEAPILQASCGLVIYQAEGWTESYGIAKEIAAFRAAGKPVVHWALHVSAASLATVLLRICSEAM